MSARYLAPFAILLPLVLLVLYQLTRRLHLHLPAPPDGADRPPLQRAQAIVGCGEVLALFLIAGGVIHGSVHGDSPIEDARWAAVFGGTALVLFTAASALSLRLLLGARLLSELARDNTACAVAAAAHLVATGIITARGVAGNNLVHLGLSLVFFLLSLLSLHVLLLAFRLLTAYDDREEIIGDNLAAALSYAGATIAVALIVGRAVEGDFAGWLPSLRGYGVAIAQGLLIYPARQLVVEGLLLRTRPSLRGGALDRLVGRERHAGIGALEGATYVAAALLLQRVS